MADGICLQKAQATCTCRCRTTQATCRATIDRSNSPGPAPPHCHLSIRSIKPIHQIQAALAQRFRPGAVALGREALLSDMASFHTLRVRRQQFDVMSVAG